LSIVAFFGIFHVVATIPDGEAVTVWEKMTVEVVCLTMVTVTESEGS